MLIQCPECELQVSDKASSCPHCGYPLQGQPVKNEKRKSNRRKRLPNGFGQITKLKNRNLRNPYRAMITVGKDENGKLICKLLKPVAYFPTYNDAYAALVEYNKNPYDLDNGITMMELYERWTNEYFEKSSESVIKLVKSTWAYCSEIYDMKVTDVKTRHIKGCINNGTRTLHGEVKTPSASFKNRIKSTLNIMLDYAVEYEIVEKNYARSFGLGKENEKAVKKERKGHMIYTDEEMDKLWENAGIPYVDMVLVQCYSGWRPLEVCDLKVEDVNISDWTFKGGCKTEAGTDRVVPIHSRIRPIIEQKYNYAKDVGSEYLFLMEGDKPMNYYNFRHRYLRFLKTLNINEKHRLHDGRMHFISMAKKYYVDEYAIKYIVGHAITDITERVYTKREVDWLKEEIEKIR